MDSDEVALTSKVEKGFFRRQFSASATLSQIAFDLLAGVVLPLVCFGVDYLWRRHWPSKSVMGGYSMFAYTAFGIQVLLLALCFSARNRLKPLMAYAGGGLLCGGAVAFGIGCILFPFTIMPFGILVAELVGGGSLTDIDLLLLCVLGLLGLVPFLTSFTLLRNGIRSLAGCKKYGSLWTVAVLVGLISVHIPYLANRELNQAISKNIECVVGSDAVSAETAADYLVKWRWFVPRSRCDWIVQA